MTYYLNADNGELDQEFNDAELALDEFRKATETAGYVMLEFYVDDEGEE